jgi:uncharacterized repeat protein (TIGR02543 family)
VSYIGYSAFSDATSLRTINFESGSRLKAISESTFKNATGLNSIIIPAGVTYIGAKAFHGASSLANLYFLGKAPTQVDALAFAGINANLTVHRISSVRFETVDGKWSKLPVAVGYAVKFFGNAQSSGLPPLQAMLGSGQNMVAPNNQGELSKVGYTFAGWNTRSNGSGTTYAPGSTIRMTNSDVNLYAKWIKNPIKAQIGTRPIISGSISMTSSGQNLLRANPGTWTGFPTPALSYQWYSCTEQIAGNVSTLPQSCAIIQNATSSRLALTLPLKGRYIVVSVTGQSAGTSPTVSYSQSTGMIR